MSETAPEFAALVVDAKACAKRIDDLRKLVEQAEKDQAQLAVDRDAHDRKVAELDAREAALALREEVCRGRCGIFQATRPGKISPRRKSWTRFEVA
jgi:hypothetical protein